MATGIFPGGSTPAETGSWANDAGIIASTFTTPSGRAMANGTSYLIITGMSLYVSARGAARTAQFILGGSWGRAFTLPTGGGGVYRYGSTWVGVVPGASYSYGIYTSGGRNFGRAVSGGSTTINGNAAWGGSLSGAYNYILAPTAPQSLSATPSTTTSGAINLSWGAPSTNGDTGITSYNVYRAGTLIATVGGATYSYTDATAVGGTSYSYTVRARNVVTDTWGTQSVDSNSAAATAPGHPNAPTSLVATPSTTVPGRIALSWTAPSVSGVGGITGYDIYQDSFRVAQTTGTGTTFNVDGLPPHLTYSFTVRARNAFSDTNASAGPTSGSVSSTAPGPPSQPLDVTATSDGAIPGNVSLTWAAPATTGGTVTGYTIYNATGDLVVATLTGTNTTATVTGLTPGTNVSLYIRARNAIADSSGQFGAPSDTVIVYVLGVPSAPTNLVVTPAPAVSGRLVLNWTSPPGVMTGYSIYRYDPSNVYQAEVRRNLATNPTFEAPGAVTEIRRNLLRFTDTSGTSGWNPTSGVLTVDSGRLKFTQNTNVITRVGATTGLLNAKIAGSYTASFKAQIMDASITGVRVYLYDSLTSTVRGQQSIPTVALGADTKYEFTLTATGDFNMVYMEAYGSSIPSGAIWYLSEPILEEGTTHRTWFNGDQKTKSRRNAATRPQAISGAGWYTNNGTLYPRTWDSTGGRRPGGGAALFVRTVTSPTATIASTNAAGGNTWNTAGWVPVSPGEVWTASAYARADKPFKTLIIIYFFDAAGAAVGLAVNGPQSATAPADSWMRAAQTVTVPAGAIYMGIGQNTLLDSGISVGGERSWMTDALIEKSATLGEYFDGDSTPANGYSHAWEGAAGATASFMSDLDLSSSWTSTVDASESILTGTGISTYVTSTVVARAIQSSRWVGYGTRSLRQIPTYPTRGSAYTEIATNGATRGLIAGRTYTIMAKFYQATSQGFATAYGRSVVFVTDAGIISTQAADVSGEQQLRLQVTIPTTGNWYLRLYNGGMLGDPSVWWDGLGIFDGVYTGDYFDGNTANTTTSFYKWFGVPHDSASIMGVPAPEEYLGRSSTTTFVVDNEPVGVPRSFRVRARNIITDQDGSPGGPLSLPATGTATGSSSQTVTVSLSVADTTNSQFNGTKTVLYVDDYSFSYANTGTEISTRALASPVSVTNNTNTALNTASATITVTGTNSFTYPKTASNLSAAPIRLTGVASDYLSNLTNQSLVGTFIISAVNAGANTFDFFQSGSDVADVATSGSVTNLSNGVFGGSKVITGITATSITYAQTSSNVTATPTAGTVVDTTNKNILNGTYLVTSVPSYNSLKMSIVASNFATRTVPAPYGKLQRSASLAKAILRFRSGWAG